MQIFFFKKSEIEPTSILGRRKDWKGRDVDLPRTKKSPKNRNSALLDIITFYFDW
jgi:hypothetical protein